MELPAFPPVYPEPRPLPAPVADEPPRLTARTLGGLEWVLAKELEAIGAADLRVGRRTVEFSAPPGRHQPAMARIPAASTSESGASTSPIRQPRWWSDRPAASR